MLKTRSVLLLIAAALLAVPVVAQSRAEITVKVVVVDKDLNLKAVPKFALTVRSSDGAPASKQMVSTSLDGTAALSLLPGSYVISSDRPLEFGGKTFNWEYTFKAGPEHPAKIELSNDNATIGFTHEPRRRVSEAGEMFKTLRNGVVTIEGELGTGTGFIFDEQGLVLTNQHVIRETNEIRVRFDKNTAVKARLIAADVERDLAVLQVNLEAFPEAQILKVAASGTTEPSLVEGEHVFTIGSPLHQEKILTAGIASKIEERAIISDINFSAGNSGGPLFNSIGEVVGVTTFRVKGKDGSALAGIVRIEEAADLSAKARAIAAAKGKPSAELMPNTPDGIFPVETIKAAVSSKDFSTKQYLSDVKDFQIKYMTPVYKFYVMEKDRIDSLKDRESRNKDKGTLDTADMFRDLRYYSEYAGELRPVVEILALPETAPTGKSMLLSAVTAATIGYSTPFAHKYKADFYQMKLMCDGKEVTPLKRSKTEIDRELQNYYKVKKRFTYAGVYSYPYDVFAPGRCRDMKLQVFAEEDLEKPITSDVQESIKKRIWTDFSDFRQRASAKP